MTADTVLLSILLASLITLAAYGLTVIQPRRYPVTVILAAIAAAALTARALNLTSGPWEHASLPALILTVHLAFLGAARLVGYAPDRHGVQ